MLHYWHILGNSGYSVVLLIGIDKDSWDNLPYNVIHLF